MWVHYVTYRGLYQRQYAKKKIETPISERPSIHIMPLEVTKVMLLGQQPQIFLTDRKLLEDFFEETKRLG